MPVEQQSQPTADGRRYKCYDLVMAAFVTVLICSNVIGAAKVTTIGGFTFGAGVLFFRSAIFSMTF